MGKGAGSSTEPTRRSGRRTLLWTLGSILLLALVVYAGAALSSPRDSKDDDGQQASVQTPDGSDGAATSERLYEQAVKARRAGETTRALELANRAVEADPGNTRAVQLTVDLSSAAASTLVASRSPSGASTSATGTSSTSGPAPGGAPVQPRVANIQSLLPASVAGYSLGTMQVARTDVVRSAEPAGGSADSRVVVRTLLSVHDRRTDVAARQWVDAVGKRLYAKNRARVTVAGGPALFGTDNARLAWTAFARGQYVFEVLITTQGNPVSAKAISLKLAEAFPVKR